MPFDDATREIILLSLSAAAFVGSWLALLFAWKASRHQGIAKSEELAAASAAQLGSLAETKSAVILQQGEFTRQAMEQAGRLALEVSTKLQGSLSSQADATNNKLEVFREGFRGEYRQHREEMHARLKELMESTQRHLTEASKAMNGHMEQTSAAIADLAERLSGRLDRFGERTAEDSRLAREEQKLATDAMAKALDAGRTAQSEALEAARESIRTTLSQISDRQGEAEARARKELGEALQRLVESEAKSRESRERSFKELQLAIAGDLVKMRQDNEAKLESIRLTVEERLHKTLQERVGESFKLVSERLDQVHKGLGEMQVLATGVGDLKRVLSNIRARGAFGEVQLRTLLEQALAPSQYKENVQIRSGSLERVEFAVCLPGRDEDSGPVLLPIDAKFPQEDYARLLDAYDRADAGAVEECRKGLAVRLLGEAAKIREKYVSPPETTDFAVLFVPTEGLFAEALRYPDLTERMQRDHHIVLAGPTTLLALLNSLQMGFQTLAIQKRSGEVWKILGAVKTEFGKFGDSLAAVRKKLQEAQNKIDQSEQRSRGMNRALRDVHMLDTVEAKVLLPGLERPEDEADDEEPGT